MRITRPAAVVAFAGTALAGAVGGAVAFGPASAGPAPAQTSGAPAEGDGEACGRGAGLDAVAETVGVPTDELRHALRDGRTLAEIAESNEIDPQAIVDALVSSGTARLEAAVAAGAVDQATADERLATLPDRATDLVHGDVRRHPRRAIGLATVADTVGIDVQDLGEALRDGQTIAEVAEAQGVDPQTVVDALVVRSTEHITRAVNGDTVRQRCR
jgi:uncharacterized protein (DUF433 family)